MSSTPNVLWLSYEGQAEYLVLIANGAQHSRVPLDHLKQRSSL